MRAVWLTPSSILSGLRGFSVRAPQDSPSGTRSAGLNAKVADGAIAALLHSRSLNSSSSRIHNPRPRADQGRGSSRNDETIAANS